MVFQILIFFTFTFQGVAVEPVASFTIEQSGMGELIFGLRLDQLRNVLKTSCLEFSSVCSKHRPQTCMGL